MTHPECNLPVTLLSVTPLHPEILELIFSYPDGFTWNSGDYIWLKNATGEIKPFSIANAPKESKIHLHVAHVDSITEWLDQILTTKTGYISQAVSQFHWPQQSSSPIICFAGGTGITPLLNLLQHPTNSHNDRQIKLFWGVRNRSLAYLLPLLEMLSEKNKSFSYQLILSAEDEYKGTDALHGLIPDLLVKGQLKLPTEAVIQGCEILICGPWAMVSGIRSALQNSNLNINSLQS